MKFQVWCTRQQVWCIHKARRIGCLYTVLIYSRAMHRDGAVHWVCARRTEMLTEISSLLPNSIYLSFTNCSSRRISYSFLRDEHLEHDSNLVATGRTCCFSEHFEDVAKGMCGRHVGHLQGKKWSTCEVGENKGEGDSHGSEDRTQFSVVNCKQFEWGCFTSIK